MWKKERGKMRGENIKGHEKRGEWKVKKMTREKERTTGR